jgi:hypothetical protein
MTEHVRTDPLRQTGFGPVARERAFDILPVQPFRIIALSNEEGRFVVPAPGEAALDPL